MLQQIFLAPLVSQCASKMAPNDPHLLQFTLFHSFLLHCTVVGLCGQEKMAKVISLHFFFYFNFIFQLQFTFDIILY